MAITKAYTLGLSGADSDFITNVVDSDYIVARASSFDSANALGLIDSDYIKTVQYLDDEKLYFGTGQDLKIYSDGSNSLIWGEGTSYLRGTTVNIAPKVGAGYVDAVIAGSTNVSIKHPATNAIKLQTSSTGVSVTGTADVDALTTSGVAVTASGVHLDDNKKLVFGTDSDVTIEYDPNSFRINAGSWNAQYQAGNHYFRNNSGSVNAMIIDPSGAITMKYNNSTKIVTTNTGVDVTGIITTDGLTSSADLNITGSVNADSATIPIMSGDITFTGNLQGPSTWYIDPAPVDSDAGLLIIRGDLQVDGTTTTVNSTTVSINDKNIVLADSAANASEADGAGITVNGASATISYDASNDEWDFNKEINIPGGKVTGEIQFQGSSYRTDWLSVGHWNYRDNVQARFGNSDDLKIYHSTDNNSYIQESGSGNLRIMADDLRIQATTGHDMINAIEGGAIELYHNTAKKLETVSTGVAITGNATATGDVQLNGGGTIKSNGTSDTLVLSGSTGVDVGGNITLHGNTHSNASQIFFKNGSTNVLTIAGGKVGIGTDNPSALQQNYIDSTSVNLGLRLTQNNSGQGIWMEFQPGNNTDDWQVGANNAGFAIYNVTDSRYDMVIKNDGNVGVGNSNPQHRIHFGLQNGYYTSIGSGNRTPGGAEPWLGVFDNSNIASATHGWGFYDSNTDGSFQIWNKNNSTTGYNTFTIKRGGNVGIGTTDPVAKLVVSNGGAEGWEIDPALIGSNHNRITNFNRSTSTYCSLTTDAASFIHRINGSNNEKLEFVSNGLNLKSATYAILNVQTDVDDNSTSNDGIIKISNGSSGTTKAEFRWDESEDKVHISYGDHGRHISIQPNGRVGIGTSTGSINNFLHLKSAASGGPQIEIESTSGTANSAFIGFDGTSLQLSTQRDMVDGSKRDTGKSWGGISINGAAAGSKILFTTSEGSNNSATTKMTISKEGYVGIGITTPEDAQASARDLVIGNGSGSRGLTVWSGTSNSGNLFFARGTSGSDLYRGYIQFNHTADLINIGAGADDRLQVLGTGYINATSASQVRLTLGNQGSAGTNNSNWIRGTGSALGLNAAATNIHFEIGGSQVMEITDARFKYYGNTGHINYGGGSYSYANQFQMLTTEVTPSASGTWMDVCFVSHSPNLKFHGMSVQSGNASYGGARYHGALLGTYGSVALYEEHKRVTAMNGGDVTNIEYRYLNSGSSAGSYRLQVRLSYTGGSHKVYTVVYGNALSVIEEDGS